MSCGNEVNISPKLKTYSFTTNGQESLFPMLRWLTALDGHFYVPDINDCKIFRINKDFEVINYIDLREQFGPFEISQVGIIDNQVIVWNRLSSSFHILTPDLKCIGQHILTHLFDGISRIAFSDKSMVGSTGKTVSKFSLENDTIEYVESILHIDTYKPCHYIEMNGYLLLISRNLPSIEVYKDSMLISILEYGNYIPEVYTTIDNFKKKLSNNGDVIKSASYWLVVDVITDGDFLYLLLVTKNSPDDYTANTAISFFLEEGVLRPNKIYKLQDIKVISSIAVTEGLLLAVGVERPTNSLLLYKID